MISASTCGVTAKELKKSGSESKHQWNLNKRIMLKDETENKR